MDHLTQVDALKESIHSQSVKDANSELRKKYTDDVLKQIGRSYVSNY